LHIIETMGNYFTSLNPVIQSLVATIFTWLMTAIGAATVFLVKKVDQKLLDAMLGFAGGIMIAVSYWSMLAPAIELGRGKDLPAWLPVTVGFLLGGFFLWLLDKILPHLNPSCPPDKVEGIKTPWQRNTLLILAITMHNIPEGLTIGVAFGAAAAGFQSASLASAMWLAIGIGIQNMPEGLAVSMPLRHEGVSRFRSFFYGQLSAIVEPMAAVIGAAIIVLVQAIIPYALGFAAGAMIFIVIEEIIPGAQRCGNSDLATIGGMLGFALMMVLEVSFG
jgi:ZIP family zinc transporter